MSPRAGTAGSYTFTVTVSDGNGGTDEKTFALNVTSPQTVNVPGKIPLSPSMVTNESAYGDPGMLVDEQAIAADPLNGAGGAPSTNWFPGYGDKHPVSAYLDLGGDYRLSNVFLYDNNGRGEFIVEHGSPGNWMPLFTDPLQFYQVWVNNEVDVSTRYLRFTRTTGSANANEVVLYGSAVSNSLPILTTVEDQIVNEGETLTLALLANDPNNGSLTYSLDTDANFVSLADNGDGTASLSLNPPNGSAGAYTVTLTVTNSSGGQANNSFNLTVESSGTGNPPSSEPLQTIGIDLNDWRGNPPSNWNGLSSAAVNTTIANLKNQLEQNTGYSIKVVDNFNGTGLSNLSTGNNSGPVPDGVMSTFWYNNNGEGKLKFVLDKTKKYTFRIYGGRDGTADDKSADYTIGDQTVSLYNLNNTQNAAVIENVIPNDSHEVFLSVKNSAGYTYAILNGIVIEEYAVASDEGEVPDHIEYQALVDLYNSTGGDEWTNNTNWLQGNTSVDFATWYGLTVNNGDVREIDLSENNLIGNIEESIGNLSNLFWLTFDDNQITSLPQSIWALDDLFKLSVNKNNLVELPEIGENPSLIKVLWFRENQIKSIPESIGRLPMIYSLYLDNNQLTTLPESIGDLSSISTLSVNNNPIVSIPESIGNLEELWNLYISFNQLTVLPESIGSLSYLMTLTVGGTKVRHLPEGIGNLKHLEHLYVENSQLEALPPNLKNLQSLKWLYLLGNKVSFESIAPFFSGTNTIKLNTFTYSPQSPPPPETISAVHGSPLTLTSDDNAPHNHYQWQKDISGIWTDISGATAISYTIPSVTEAGQYRCEITNDWVTDLTLYSQNFVVEVGEKLSPQLPADLVKNRPNDETGP